MAFWSGQDRQDQAASRLFSVLGKIIIDDLKVGKYYILEKEASTGYVITTEKVYFEVKDNGEIDYPPNLSKTPYQIIGITPIVKEEDN